MSTQEKNFWLTTVDAPQIPTRDLPQLVDVAVIGGGFTGLSARGRWPKAARKLWCWKLKMLVGARAAGTAGWC